jgi:hypothetical protein
MGDKMTDEATETPAPETSEKPAEEPTSDEKPAQADTDWKAEARKWEERAKANKGAAERLAEIEDANKSEVQKAAERAAALEAERDQAKVESLRYKLAAKYGLSDEDAELLLNGPDEETMQQQAARLAARDEEKGQPRTPRPDANQGRSSPGNSSTAEQFAASVRNML